MQAQHLTLGAGLGDLGVEEGDQRALRHAGAVDDLVGLEGDLLQHAHGAVGAHVLDAGHRGRGHGHRLLVAAKVARGHGGHVGLGVGGPLAHAVGVLPGEGLDGGGGAAVGVALAEHRVHGTTLDLVVAGLDGDLRVVFGLVGVVGQRVALGLELGHGSLELGDRGADVGQLDDVGLGPQRERAELGEGIGDPLLLGQHVGEHGEEPASQGDVACLDVDARGACEGLDDRQEAVGGQGGGFVGVRVDDRGLDVGHGRASLWAGSETGSLTARALGA